MKLMTGAILAIALAAACPGAWADSAFTLGIEAKSVFARDMKLASHPTVTRTHVDNNTSQSTTRSTDYFSDFDAVSGATTTTQRSWNNIADNSNYLFLKGSFATEYLELVLRMGAASKHVSFRQPSYADTATAGQPDTITQGTSVSNLVELPQGFAYGFNVRGEPYQTDDFQVLVDIHFTQVISKGNRSQSFSLATSTGGIFVNQNNSTQIINIDERTYGLATTVAMRFEHFHPYLGLSYDDGVLKGDNQTTTLAQTTTTNLTTIEDIQYLLKPKSKVSLVVGLSFPFERGGINIEGRMQGEASLSIGGFIGF